MSFNLPPVPGTGLPGQGSSNPVVSTTPATVQSGQSFTLADHVSVTDTPGYTVKDYFITDNSGSIQLNGATNLQGGLLPGSYEVSAADFGKLTFLGGAAGTVDVKIGVYDGTSFSTQATEHVTVTGASTTSSATTHARTVHVAADAGLPHLPALPTLPDVPTFTQPATPALPTLPALPDVPTFTQPATPSLPTLPTLPDVPTFSQPATPSLPALPAIPSVSSSDAASVTPGAGSSDLAVHHGTSLVGLPHDFAHHSLIG